MDFVSWVFAPNGYDQHKPLLIDAADPSRYLSFSQLQLQVRQLVAGLKSIGIQPGDCVCVNSFNDIQYSVLYFGVIGAGARFTGVNPAYSSQELTHHMTMTKAKAIIVEPQMLDATLASAKECGIPLSNVFVFDVYQPNPRNDVRAWSVLLQHGESDFFHCDPDKTVASYQTSSGTSGLPKAAMIVHSFLIVQANLRVSGPLVNYEVRRLTALPPMHVYAAPIVPGSIRQGCEVYVMRRYDTDAFIRAIERYQISETFVAPPPLIGIPKSPLATKVAMKSIRQIWMGGASVSYANQLPMYSILHPDARINQNWGMTEVGWTAAVQWPHKQMDDSVGKPVPGYDVRVADDSGRIVKEPFARGELQILAPHPMLGYLNNPTASAEAFTVDRRGRWVNTGDIGYLDDQGNVFIVDRKKDLVKVRGWQVSPAEVEGRLLQHPDVVDAGVIGLPLPNGTGEIVRAYVVLRDGSHPTEDEIKEFVTANLARYKCPEEIIFTDAIPKNPTGKILRRVLRDRALGDQQKLEALSSPAASIFTGDESISEKESPKRRSRTRGCFGVFALFLTKMCDPSRRRT